MFTTKLTKEEFYEWIAKHESRILQKQNEQDIRLKNFEREIHELSRRVFDDERMRQEFDGFFYKTILPKVGTIVDKKETHTEKAIEHLHEQFEELDRNTVKKSNVSKYVGALIGIIFAGGIGSTWNALYEVQSKLNSVPQLIEQVDALKEEQRSFEKKIFIVEGNIVTLKESMSMSDDNLIKLKTELGTIREIAETSSFSISDIYSKLKLLITPSANNSR